MTKKQNKAMYLISIILYIIVAVYISVKYFITSNFVLAVISLLSLVFLLVPQFAEKIFKFRLGYAARAVVLFFFTIAFQLGVLLRFYDRIAFYDIAMHLLSGVFFTLIGFLVYAKMNRHPHLRADNTLMQVVFTFSFSMLIAVFWEICEFVVFLLIGHDAQHHLDTGVFDTMEDLISCFIGSIITALDYLIWVRLKKKLPISRLIDSFDKENDF